MPEIEPIAVETAAAAADLEEEPAAPTRVLAWEEDTEVVLASPIEEALPEPELVVAVEAEAEPEPEPETVVAVEAEAEPEPEPVAAVEAEPEPEPEPVAASRPSRSPSRSPLPRSRQSRSPSRSPLPRSRQSRSPSRHVLSGRSRRPSCGNGPPLSRAPSPADEQAVAARRAQMDLLGLDDPGIGRVTPERSNVLPYRSSGAAAAPSELAHRTVGSPATLWDASAREVAAARSAVAVQSCGSCGLSLSASARFCRRCGSRQAQSA